MSQLSMRNKQFASNTRYLNFQLTVAHCQFAYCRLPLTFGALKLHKTMANKLTAAITAVGAFVPEDKLTNADLEKMVDTNDEWIRTRTGISERRILKGDGKATSDLATPAVLELCKKRGIDPLEIDCIIVATVTPDMMFPATANIVADAVGAKNAWGFDMSAACSG